MASDNRISMPSGMGGLMRYDAEYESKVMLAPEMVVAFVAGVVLFVLALNIIFPIIK